MSNGLSNKIRFALGVLIWIGLIVGGVALFRQSTDTSPVAVRQIVDYMGSREWTLDVESPTHLVLGVGDPVFLETESGRLEPIGVISTLDYPGAKDPRNPVTLAWVEKASVRFLSELPELHEGDYLQYNETSDSLAWVGQTMLNAKKRAEISELIVGAYADHQTELVETFRPLIKQTIADSGKIIRDEIALEIDKHQQQIQAIGKRYRTEVLEKQILPVLEKEVWPIIREEGEPLAEVIGMEIWREVSVWRFGWRYLYDATPLPERNLSQKEFDRFLERKVVPILKSHITDAVELQSVLLKKISQNESLKKTLANAGKKLFQDEEVKSLVKEIFNNAIVDNEKLKQSIEKTWQSDSAVAAMRIANSRVEPVVTEIGKSLFGSPLDGITPEFSKVLRNRVLHKDDRWLVLKLADRDIGSTPSTHSEEKRSSNIDVADPRFC